MLFTLRRLFQIAFFVLFLASCASATTGTPVSTSFADPSIKGTEAKLHPTNTDRPPTSTPFPNTPSATLAPTLTLEPSPTPTWIGPEVFPPDVNPLTGLQVSDPSLLDRRPVMIKVSNYPAYFPSWPIPLWHYHINLYTIELF